MRNEQNYLKRNNNKIETQLEVDHQTFVWFKIKKMSAQNEKKNRKENNMYDEYVHHLFKA